MDRVTMYSSLPQKVLVYDNHPGLLINIVPLSKGPNLGDKLHSHPVHLPILRIAFSHPSNSLI